MEQIEISKIKDADYIQKVILDAQNSDVKPLVVIRCIAYNQEKYLAQTLDGFVMQKTTFPFVAVVHDDASVDGTATVLKKYADCYPEVIRPIYDKVNRYREYSLGVVMKAIVDAYNPKYIAICEGDDFWTDPFKLQKQVDYLEKHQECVMCHTNYTLLGDVDYGSPKHFDDEPFFGPGHLHTYSIGAFTALYRKEAEDKSPNAKLSHNWKLGDFPRWIELSQQGKFHYMEDVTGTYRVLDNSASHYSDIEKYIPYWESKNDIIKYYSELYGYPYNPLPISDLYLNILKSCYKQKNKELARKYWKLSRKKEVVNLRIALFYFCTVYNQKWLMNFVNFLMPLYYKVKAFK